MLFCGFYLENEMAYSIDFWIKLIFCRRSVKFPTVSDHCIVLELMIIIRKLHFLHKFGRSRRGWGIVYISATAGFGTLQLFLWCLNYYLVCLQFIDTVPNGHVLLYLLWLHFIYVTAVNRQKCKSKLWSAPINTDLNFQVCLKLKYSI